MRDALPELGLQARIGVMTGEVVTGTAERLATGDAINVAARLEQAARPGEVLLGAPTYALVRGAADVEQVEPLALKGKAEHVRAFRLLGLHAPPARRHDAAFVGRKRELALIRDAWARVQAEQRCELLTVVGEPGVGKSRLVAEALAAIEAPVVSGRCLPYGEGITYWPVVEVLKQLDALPETGPAAGAIARCSAGAMPDLGRGDRLGVPQGARVGERRTRRPHSRLRRHPVGRGGVPRRHRPRRPAGHGRADPDPLHRASRVGRSPCATGRSSSGSTR